MKNEKETPKNQQNSIGREIWEYVRIVLIVVVAVTLVNQFLIINAVIPSGSMETTIMEGDRIFGNRLAYLNSDPERFDIIIFKYPDDETKTFIKRVIGLPGETVQIKDGKIYVDGKAAKNYSDESISSPGVASEEITLGSDEYFVLGDNYSNSEDSRSAGIGNIKRSNIIGKVSIKYWPWG